MQYVLLLLAAPSRGHHSGWSASILSILLPHTNPRLALLHCILPTFILDVCL